MNELFQRYADIKKQIKSLEAQEEELKGAVLAELVTRTQDLVDKNLKFEFGTFSVTERRAWKYSEKVAELEARVSQVKKDEEEAGIAVATVTKGLRFQ